MLLLRRLLGLGDWECGFGLLLGWGGEYGYCVRWVRWVGGRGWYGWWYGYYALPRWVNGSGGCESSGGHGRNFVIVELRRGMNGVALVPGVGLAWTAFETKVNITSHLQPSKATTSLVIQRSILYPLFYNP